METWGDGIPVAVVMLRVQRSRKREADMSVKCLLMLVATVVLTFASVGCTTMRPPPSGEDQTLSGEAQIILKITATKEKEGDIRITAVDRNGKKLPELRVDDPTNLLKFLREHFQQQVKNGTSLTIVLLSASPDCLLSCIGGYCAYDCE
jgi:hypothetical protein